MWHLPGNRPCPYGALYELHWEAQPLPAVAGRIYRPVCAVHLVAALDEALTRPVVMVTLVQQ